MFSDVFTGEIVYANEVRWRIIFGVYKNFVCASNSECRMGYDKS